MIQKTVLCAITPRFRHFPKYYMKIMLGDSNAKLDVFQPIIRNESASGLILGY